MYIISACLAGENVKYNGGNNYNQKVMDFLKDKEYVLVCPETAGGLKAPRDPAERIGDKVIDRVGRDLTEAFHEGARRCLEQILETTSPEDIEGAILKARSPSCGSGVIYDGTFSGRKIPSEGITAAMLREAGYRVISEKDVEAIEREHNKG